MTSRIVAAVAVVAIFVLPMLIYRRVAWWRYDPNDDDKDPK